MMEFFDTQPTVNVQESEYHRLLGYPRDHELTGRARELADATREWFAAHGRPWVYARENMDFEIANRELRIGGVDFSSRQLHDQFVAAEAHDVVLVAVSAGRQCEEKAREFWQDGKPDEYFFMEMFGSAVVEHLITTTGARLCGWAEESGMSVLPHYSPGYSGWDVADQNKLLTLIRGTKARGWAGEIEALDSGMLRPKKSLLAVFGITRRLDKARSLASLIPCENCAFAPCQYRRVPYQHSLPPMEDVRRLQGGWQDDSVSTRPVTAPLNLAAKYSINARALRKWSQARLSLKIFPDGAVEAQFRYEGTTCSNMGQPLAYDYHVRLRSPEENYAIAEASCVPAIGDLGHTAQCAYLSDRAELQRNIASEITLLGQPLNDVLDWDRPSNPAGCYCEASSRAHKWGLVLEVIHFALAQRLKEQTNGQAFAIPEYSRPPV